MEKEVLKLWLKREAAKMAKYKAVTKWATLILGAAYGWLSFDPAGQVLVKEHPQLATIVSFLAIACAAFHVPIKKGTVAAIFFALGLFASPALAQGNEPPPADPPGLPADGVRVAVTSRALVTQTSTSATAPSPVTSTVNFQIGAGALGIAATSQATPATDIKLELNPGFVKLPALSLLSDNLLAPGANLQYYGGGVSYDLPKIFPKTSMLAPVDFYVRGSVGVDRIVPASGAGQSHIAFLAGGGLAWEPSSTVRIQLVEIDDGHFPGAPFGANAPVISGGLSLLFGKQ